MKIIGDWVIVTFTGFAIVCAVCWVVSTFVLPVQP